MAYRWKVPELNASFVDPQGVQAYQQSAASAASANAAQQMQGYHPTGTDMYGMNEGVDRSGLGDYNQAQEYEQQQKRQEVQAKISELQQQLAQVDAQIEAINQKLGGVSDRDLSIAAARAEAGDYSAYDNMISRAANREQANKTAANNRSAELQNARKLVWGLNSKDSDQQAAAFNQVDLALEKFERKAQELGINPESDPDYRALKAERDKAAGAVKENQNARETATDWWKKVNDKTLTDNDIKTLEDKIASDPNNPEVEELRKLVDENKGKTVEARARYTRRKNAAYQKAKALQDATPESAINEWNSMTEAERKEFSKFYTVDIKTDKDGKKIFSLKKKV